MADFRSLVLEELNEEGAVRDNLLATFESGRDFILIAHDDDCDGVYEDAEANWFSVGFKERLEISANLKSLGSKLKGSI